MNIAYPVLPIGDPDKAEQFYSEILGFEVVLKEDYANQPDDGTLIVVARLGACLHLVSPMVGHHRRGCVHISAGRYAEKLIEEWRSKVKITFCPESGLWGPCSFCVEDPFKNVLIVYPR